MMQNQIPSFCFRTPLILMVRSLVSSLRRASSEIFLIPFRIFFLIIRSHLPFLKFLLQLSFLKNCVFFASVLLNFRVVFIGLAMRAHRFAHLAFILLLFFFMSIQQNNFLHFMRRFSEFIRVLGIKLLEHFPDISQICFRLPCGIRDFPSLPFDQIL